jgi:hypothetical protein
MTLTSPASSPDPVDRDSRPPPGVPSVVFYLPYREAKRRIVDPFEKTYVRLLRTAHGANLSAASRASGLSRRHLRALYRKHGLT